MRRTLHRSGPAPAALVAERYAAYARWSEWSPQIRGVETDGERLARGATGTVRGPLGVRVRFRVERVEGGDWSWVVRCGPVRLRLEHGVRALRDGGSVTRLVSEGPAPYVLGYEPLARLALGRLVRDLSHNPSAPHGPGQGR
ncbi:SRPBCC family protein [Streptomyces sp. NPDC047046]|uniref:SRPBCC family protein n=1 Tax=Streptomyces sp. NPDC047046 TaxID=3155378 RepID=UPI0033C7A55E